MRALVGTLIAIFVAFVVFINATYTLNPGTQAMVFRFNQLIDQQQDPGLHFKLPLVDEVRKVGAFVYEYDGDDQTFLALNAEPVVVDYYITYRIVDLGAFQKQVAGSVSRLEDLLRQAAVTSIQTSINSRSQTSILAEGREEMRVQVFDSLRALQSQYGISLQDFRVNRVDLPEVTKKEFEESMIQERVAEKEDILTRASADARKIRAEAQRNAAQITEQARQRAQALIGLGTREEIVLKDQGFGTDPTFFTFYKRVEEILEGKGIPQGQFVVSDVDSYLRDFLGYDAALLSARSLPAGFSPLEDLTISKELQATLDSVTATTLSQ